MSLKAFHLVFVIASILLGLGVGGWGILEYRATGEVGALLLGLIFLAMGIGLFFYGRNMLKKTKDIGYLALAGLLFAEQNAAACASCYGESDAPMADGMNAGIFTLLVVVGSLLGGIAGFFIFIMRRGARLASRDALLRDPSLMSIEALSLDSPANRDTTIIS